MAKVHVENITQAVNVVGRTLHSDAYGHAVARIMRKGMEKYIPLDTGNMRDTAQVTPFTVTYVAPYSVYPWTPNGRIHTDKNPNATAHWPEHYFAVNLDDFTRACQATLDAM